MPMSRRDVLKAGAGLTVSPAVLAMCGSTAGAADPYADARLVAHASADPVVRRLETFPTSGRSPS